LGSDNVWRPSIIRKTANESVQNNTLQNDDDLKWTVAANEVWKFKLFLIVSSVNTTMDMKVGWTYPTGATCYWGSLAANSAGGGSMFSLAVGSTQEAVMIESTVPAFGSNGGRQIVVFEGVWTIGANAGTVQLQWAQNTTNANNLTVETNSHLELIPLA
jgi:hypothetical protein